MPRTFYTIDDLAKFCMENNFTNFSAKEHNNKPLIIQSFETFEAAESVNDGLLPVKLMACHVGLNRNKSSISEDTMRRRMGSFKGRPILANIIKTETGEYEFHSHDMTINEDNEVEYIERPVGVISEVEEPYLEYNKEEDKTYLHVSGNIFTDYSRAADILERRRTCKCSVEIAVNEMSWNADENYLSIDDFIFMGVTILGYEQDGVTEIQEGMKGSKITIDNFSAKQNSMFNENYSNQIIDLLSNINNKLDNLSYTKLNEKGVEKEMNHFEELLTKYGVTAEQCEFDYENMTDEELDAKFAELFDDGEGEGEASTEGAESTEGEAETETETEGEEETVEETEETESEAVVPTSDEESEEEVSDDSIPAGKKKEYELTFRLSHDDIKYGLYNLLDAMGCMCYIFEVYDDMFIYQSWEDGRCYKHTYSKDGDNLALEGDPVEVFSTWVTKEEKDALETLKADYAVLKEFKENIEAAELKAEKDAVFASPEYADICETEEFKALVADADKYSVEEVKVKADLLFAAHVKAVGNFAVKKPAAKSNSIGVNLKAKPSKKAQAFGGLFDE